MDDVVFARCREVEPLTIPYAMNAVGIASRPRPMRSAADAKRRLAQLYYRVLHHFAHQRYVAKVEDYANRGLMAGGWFQKHKYLGEYFARSFSRRDRREAVLSHYRFVLGLAGETLLRRIGGEGIVLWDHAFDDHVTSIRLRTSRFAPMEGEWQLQYVVDGTSIGTLTFLFATLPRFADHGAVVCLIGGVQGGRDCREAIRIAAKGTDEIAASAMLVIAARAIAKAFGVESVFGISSREQVFGLYSADRMKADYDALWISDGASSVIEGFHALTFDRVERDLGDISRSHRRRTKRKRERKAAIHDHIVETTMAAIAAADGGRE